MTNFVSPDGEYATRDCAACGQEIRISRIKSGPLRRISPPFQTFRHVPLYCLKCYLNGVRAAIEYYDGWVTP